MKHKAAAVGTFDGVHRGHDAVLNLLKQRAREEDLEPVAFTFDRHPLSLIAPQRAPLAISSTERKCETLLAKGVTPIVVPFDEKLRATTAREWMRMLHDEYGVRLLVVGYDNTFGSDGVNLSIGDYRAIGKETGIEVEEAPLVEGISSSAIRKAVAAGNIAEADNMLGRPFRLDGIVVEGNKLGRTIGFPTANVMAAPGLIIPGNGVYAAIAVMPDGSRKEAVVNVGVRPTVRRGNNLTVEAHIFDWHGDLYGYEISLAFISRLREERQFNSIDALRRQIEKDASEAKLLLSDATKTLK